MSMIDDRLNPRGSADPKPENQSPQSPETTKGPEQDQDKALDPQAAAAERNAEVAERQANLAPRTETIAQGLSQTGELFANTDRLRTESFRNSASFLRESVLETATTGQPLPHEVPGSFDPNKSLDARALTGLLGKTVSSINKTEDVSSLLQSPDLPHVKPDSYHSGQAYRLEGQDAVIIPTKNPGILVKAALDNQIPNTNKIKITFIASPDTNGFSPLPQEALDRHQNVQDARSKLNTTTEVAPPHPKVSTPSPTETTRPTTPEPQLASIPEAQAMPLSPAEQDHLQREKLRQQDAKWREWAANVTEGDTVQYKPDDANSVETGWKVVAVNPNRNVVILDPETNTRAVIKDLLLARHQDMLPTEQPNRTQTPEEEVRSMVDWVRNAKPGDPVNYKPEGATAVEPNWLIRHVNPNGNIVVFNPQTGAQEPIKGTVLASYQIQESQNPPGA